MCCGDISVIYDFECIPHLASPTFAVSRKAMGEFGELKSKYAEEVERRLAVEEEMVALQSKLNDGQREKFIQGQQLLILWRITRGRMTNCIESSPPAC